MTPGESASSSRGGFGPKSPPDEAIAEAAAAWVARRDRGLTAPEARALAAWEAADPTHAAELAHFGRSWRDLADISALPDLAAEARALDATTAARTRLRQIAWWASGLAAAAMIAFLATVFVRNSASPGVAVAGSTPSAAGGTFLVLPGAARSLVLPDGTTVELNGESEVAPDFTPAVRRVRLLRGEAHFTVSKDTTRPFIVRVDGVEVRAVGTAFNVRRASTAVEVLVTEGKVQVEGNVAGAPVAASPVEAGQRAVVTMPSGSPALELAPSAGSTVAVTTVSLADIADSISWQGTRLVFDRLPLGLVVEVFNRHNRRQLRLGDPLLQHRRVSGIFRTDNLDGFVRLMADAFDISAETDAANAIVLRPAR